MCDFISWIEHQGDIYFLTNQELNTKEGRELKEYLGTAFYDDIKGHGAIDRYWGLKDKGIHGECTDFSTPDNFPPVIVEAIKKGLFEGIGAAEGILTPTAWAEYKKAEQAVWAEYEKVQQAAMAEYKKVQQPAIAEYEKVQQPAWAEYEKVQQPAWAEYKRVEQAVWAEYEKVQQAAFWALARDKKNRTEVWK